MCWDRLIEGEQQAKLRARTALPITEALDGVEAVVPECPELAVAG